MYTGNARFRSVLTGQKQAFSGIDLSSGICETRYFEKLCRVTFFYYLATSKKELKITFLDPI